MSIADQLQGKTPGVNHTITCPECGYRDCSAIMLDNYLMWHCFRATCGKSGYEVISGARQPQEPRIRRPVFTPQYVPDRLAHSAHVTRTGLYSFDGEFMGTQTRDYSKNIRNWMVMDRVPYCYVPPEDALEFGFPLWLVEDVRSAKALAKHGQPAVALLGTSIKDRFIEEELIPWLVRNHTPKILVALDPDATIVAMKQSQILQRAISFHTLREPSLRAKVQWVPIAMDIKDMETTRIRDLILAYAAPEGT